MIPFEHYQQSAEYLQQRLGAFRPQVLLILGTGLGELAERVEQPICVNYADIPHFRRSTAPGHAGRFVFGRLSGKNVAVMQGRMHFYEGYSPEELVYGVRVARLLGAEAMIVTNAAGAVNTSFRPGDLMLITDHLLLYPCSPLRGENLPQFGERFPDMSKVYTPALQDAARRAAARLGIGLQEGVYMYFPGPQFETPAEIRAARVLGADAAGMSTVPEAIAARHCGMQVLGFTLATNMAAGILDQPLTEAEVFETAARAHEAFRALILGCLEEMEIS